MKAMIGSKESNFILMKAKNRMRNGMCGPMIIWMKWTFHLKWQ